MSQAIRIKTLRHIAGCRSVRVTVRPGSDECRHLDVVGRKISIGSGVENDLVLDDTAVSRVHCTLQPTEFGLRVCDAGSTSGIWIQGNRVFDALLVSYPVSLKLGGTEIRVAPLDATLERGQLEAGRFGQILGRSSSMRSLFAELHLVAATDLSVLIEGETGTGKELVADAIHRHSLRRAAPLIVFDCSAVAPMLAESELFGHVRGAFTGATHQRIGVFEEARGGTIFLDELGELPKELQPKLLRVLEKREVRRVGDSRAVPVEFRLVSATNRNLTTEIQKGRFREDLYFRVAGARVVVPPLRARMDDLPLLVKHFMALHDPPIGQAAIGEHVWERLLSHRWPGNVRELKNFVERISLTPDQLWPEWLPASSVDLDLRHEEVVPLRTARRQAINAFEKDYLSFVLRRCGGNITRAAASIEISRQMFHKLLRRHAMY